MGDLTLNKKSKNYISTYIRCETCYHWKNIRDIHYNTIHKNIKLCGSGFIVKKFTMSCKFYSEERPDVFFKRKKQKPTRTKNKPKFKRAPVNKFAKAIESKEGVKKVFPISLNCVVYKKHDKFFVAYGDDEKVEIFIKFKRFLNKISFKTDLGSADLETQVYLIRSLDSTFGRNQGKKMMRLIYELYGDQI